MCGGEVGEEKAGQEQQGGGAQLKQIHTPGL